MSPLGRNATVQVAQQASRPIIQVCADVDGGAFSINRLAEAYPEWTRNHAAHEQTEP